MMLVTLKLAKYQKHPANMEKHINENVRGGGRNPPPRSDRVKIQGPRLKIRESKIQEIMMPDVKIPDIEYQSLRN